VFLCRRFSGVKIEWIAVFSDPLFSSWSKTAKAFDRRLGDDRLLSEGYKTGA